jgi:hypothetical protein
MQTFLNDGQTSIPLVIDAIIRAQQQLTGCPFDPWNDPLTLQFSNRPDLTLRILTGGQEGQILLKSWGFCLVVGKI